MQIYDNSCKKSSIIQSIFIHINFNVKRLIIKNLIKNNSIWNWG